MINRRALISHSVTLLTTALMNKVAQAREIKIEKKNLALLHTEVINCVKALVGTKKIELVLLYPKGCLPNLTPIIDSFSQKTGVKIQLKETGVDDINSTILFKTAQRDHFFDIALPATFGIPDLVNANVLAPLDQYRERYEPVDYKQYQLYDYGDYVDNQFYGYQTDGDTYLMFYNKAMIDKPEEQQSFARRYGYSLAIPETWEQLDTMIEFFHRPERQQYGGCLFRTPGYGAWEWWSRFHAKGYYPFDKDLNPQINNSAGIDALQEMINVSRYLHPKTASDGLFENWASFAEGQTFCNIGWGGSQKYFNGKQSSVKDSLYYAPAPGGKFDNKIVSCPIFNWGWNYVVSSLCPHADIAYLFSLYACSPVISTLAVQQNGFFDPFREEHYSDSTIEQAYSKEFLVAHRQSMKNCVPDFYVQNQSIYLSSLQENIHLAYKGSLSVKQALDITAAQWQLQTAKIGRKQQKKKWQNLKKKYPPALRKVLK
ncbi:MAG: extracellular solute-binding protein [Pseudomonadota bacterium]